MGRSLKKGPFVNAKLLKAIDEMNAANEKKVIKTWSRPSTCLLYTSMGACAGATQAAQTPQPL